MSTLPDYTQRPDGAWVCTDCGEYTPWWVDDLDEARGEIEHLPWCSVKEREDADAVV